MSYLLNWVSEKIIIAITKFIMCMQKTVCSSDKGGGNRPFANLKELLKNNG